MCAFGRLKPKRAEVAITPTPGALGAIAMTATVHAAPLVVPNIHRHVFSPPAVTDRRAAFAFGERLGTRGLKVEPVEATSAILGRLRFGTVAHAVEPIRTPALHKGLEAARRQPVRRRSVPVRLLSSAQEAHWQERLGASKRVAPKHVAIVALFPNVALGENQPVQFLADEAALAYHLPLKPGPLSTVVVARNAATGELLLGRFAQD